jgi:hypothetical protein
MPWQRFGMENLFADVWPLPAGLCQQSETFDEDDLYEATTRLRRRPAGIVICSLRSQCAFPRELVEVVLDQKLKSLGQNSTVEFNQRLLNLMQTSKET